MFLTVPRDLARFSHCSTLFQRIFLSFNSFFLRLYTFSTCFLCICTFFVHIERIRKFLYIVVERARSHAFLHVFLRLCHSNSFFLRFSTFSMCHSACFPFFLLFLAFSAYSVHWRGIPSIPRAFESFCIILCSFARSYVFLHVFLHLCHCNYFFPAHLQPAPRVFFDNFLLFL